MLLRILSQDKKRKVVAKLWHLLQWKFMDIYLQCQWLIKMYLKIPSAQKHLFAFSFQAEICTTYISYLVLPWSLIHTQNSQKCYFSFPCCCSCDPHWIRCLSIKHIGINHIMCTLEKAVHWGLCTDLFFTITPTLFSYFWCSSILHLVSF